MKKIISIIVSIIITGLTIVVIAGMYRFNYLTSQPGYEVYGNKIDTEVQSSSPKNASYTIDGKSFELVDGVSVKKNVSGSDSEMVTKYFGNEVKTDLNNDGREDVVFLLAQSAGGSGEFFYVVASLNTENGWSGSRGFLLGDRIAPQTTELSQNPNHKNVIVVNYMDRDNDQAMTDRPSVGKSVWIKLDPETMDWGEVAQDFEGEANPDVMTLNMKKWTWVKTTYNNDTELVPNDSDDFTLTFKDNGSFSATTDCNAMGGQYELVGNKISFNEIMATEMFCEGSKEQEFSKMLREIQSYFFTSTGELVFDLKFDNGSSVFK